MSKVTLNAWKQQFLWFGCRGSLIPESELLYEFPVFSQRR